MFPEPGHHTGAFRLATALRARGHRIVFLGLADFEDLVVGRGFEFIAFARDLLPMGYVPSFTASLARSKGPGPRRRSPDDERVFTAWLARIEDGSLDACIRACAPDLVLCDPFVWYVGLRALRLGVPTINLFIVLHLYANSEIPPVIWSMTPAAGPLSAVVVRSAWWWMALSFLFTKRLESALWGSYRFPTRMHHLEDVIRRLSRGAGIDPVAGRTYRRGEIGPWLNLPGVVLTPRALQFPGAAADGFCYAGDPVDLERPETPVDDVLPPGESPLVYCSLGSSAAFYPHAGRFFRAVLAVAKRRRDLRFVLHTGDRPDDRLEGEAPPNLVVRRRVPQLALLRQASVMVTHGGMNSILECIRFSVPMVIVPAMRDQPGNAARAVHLGLAFTAKMEGISPERLESLIERARSDAGIRGALSTIRDRIDREPGIDAAVRFIEGHAAGGRSA